MSVTNPPADLDAAVAGLADGLEIFALRRLQDLDDARDAVQETLARLLERLRTEPAPDPVELPLIAYGIARHVIVDALRRRGRLVALEGLPEEMSPASGSTALDMLVREEDLTRMRVALPRLSADDRELLDRCYIGGETVTAIAASTGEPAERLRKRKSRALSRLRELLGCSRDASHESARSSMEEQ